MVNSYHKILNSKIKFSYKEKFIEGLHQELKESIFDEDYDIFSMLNNKKSNDTCSKLDINLLLKYYILNQIIESKEHTKKQEFIDTKNPSIKTDKNGNFYKITDDGIIRDDSVTTVNNDGTYVKEEKQNAKSLRIIRTYNYEHQVISIQILDSAGRKITNKNLASEFIGLKKEYKKRYKYSGYSGNSVDMVASIRNFFSSPIETGYFMDSHCSYYKWQSSTCSFIKIFEREADSPFLVDIEFMDNGTILRQEYTGIVK